MEEGKAERYLASGRQYGNALLGVRHQQEEEEEEGYPACKVVLQKFPNFHFRKIHHNPEETEMVLW